MGGGGDGEWGEGGEEAGGEEGGREMNGGVVTRFSCFGHLLVRAGLQPKIMVGGGVGGSKSRPTRILALNQVNSGGTEGGGKGRDSASSLGEEKKSHGGEVW